MEAYIALAVLLAFYFIPTVNAVARRHHNKDAVFLLNLLLGWTILGWIGALVWSATAVRAPRDV